MIFQLAMLDETGGQRMLGSWPRDELPRIWIRVKALSSGEVKRLKFREIFADVRLVSPAKFIGITPGLSRELICSLHLDNLYNLCMFVRGHPRNIDTI